MLHDQHYIYDSIEAEKLRLERLNTVYNPNTQESLRRLFKPKMRILEVGLGVGLLGSWLAKEAAKVSGHYVGLDKDQKQIDKAKLTFSEDGILNGKLVCCSLEDLDSLGGLGQFDIIYGRWVLAHLDGEKMPPIVKQLYSMLKPGGYLVCEEGDVYDACCVRSVSDGKMVIKNVAFAQWVRLTKDLEELFKLNFRLGSILEKLFLDHLKPMGGILLSLNEFQPVLKSKEHKSILSLALPALKKTIASNAIMGDSNAAQLERDLWQLADDDQCWIKYIKNFIVAIQRS